MIAYDYDVIIVGAGPAGTTAAARIASTGMSVLLLEKYPLPRSKTCGGGVTRRALQKMPVDITPIIRESIDSLIVFNQGAKKQVFTHHRPYLFMVMRDELDYLLANHAIACGTKIETGEAVRHIEETKDAVIVSTKSKQYQCRYLLGADGVNSTVARLCGLAKEKQKILALEYEVAQGPTYMQEHPRSIMIDYGAVANGYLWVFPKHDHYSIGVGSFGTKAQDLQAILHQFLERHAIMDAVIDAKGHHLSLGGRSLKVATKRILLLGDAAGFVEPFGGEGIYYAVYSGEIAANHVIEQGKQASRDLSGYQALIEREIMPELTMLSKVNDVFYPNIGLIHRMITRYPQFMHKGFSVLEGEKSYVKVYPVLKRVLSAGKGIGLITRYFG